MSKFIIVVKEPGVFSDEIKHKGISDIESLIDVVTDDYTLNKKAEESYKEMLNDCFGVIKIGNLEYPVGDNFKGIDRIAYREMYYDYIDSEVRALKYKVERSDKIVQEYKFLGSDISITDVEKMKGETWILGVHKNDIDRCTHTEIFESINDLMEFLQVSEIIPLEKAFNDMLNAKYGCIKIDYAEYFASEILYEVDISEYNNRFDAWISDIIQSNILDVCDEYTTVVIPQCEIYAVYKIRSEKA